MDDMDKKIAIVFSGFSLPDDCPQEDLEKLFALASNTPVDNNVQACFFKKLLIDQLEEIASGAVQERSKLNPGAQEGSFWELEATTRLFYEASHLVQSISGQCTVVEFREAVKKSLQEKGGDWGYGSNWSDSIHHFVMRKLTAELSRFIGDLPAIYNECVCICRGGV